MQKYRLFNASFLGLLAPGWKHKVARTDDGNSLFGGLERSLFSACVGDSVVGLCMWGSIWPGGTSMFGKSTIPHRTTAGSWCHQGMLWPLQCPRDSVYRTELTDSFFLMHNMESLTPNWVTCFFFPSQSISYVVICGLHVKPTRGIRSFQTTSWWHYWMAAHLFVTGFCYVAQAGSELVILLPQTL